MTEFNQREYELRLTAERGRRGVNLAVFDEALHPRLHGKFTHKQLRETLQGLRVGQQLHLDNGTKIHVDRNYDTKKGKQFRVVRGGTKATPKDIRRRLEMMGQQHTHLLDNQLPSTHRAVLIAVDDGGVNPAKNGHEIQSRLQARQISRGANNAMLAHPDSHAPAMDFLRRNAGGVDTTHKTAGQAAHAAIHHQEAVGDLATAEGVQYQLQKDLDNLESADEGGWGSDDTDLWEVASNAMERVDGTPGVEAVSYDMPTAILHDGGVVAFNGISGSEGMHDLQTNAPAAPQFEILTGRDKQQHLDDLEDTTKGMIGDLHSDEEAAKVQYEQLLEAIKMARAK